MIGERIKLIRKTLDVTQQEFSDRLGIARNNIAGYETNKRSPSDAVVSLICTKYNVNESWLRTGEGGDRNMFIKDFMEDEYMAYATEIGNGGSEIIKNALIKYGRLSPKNRKIIDDALELLISTIKEG